MKFALRIDLFSKTCCRCGKGSRPWCAKNGPLELETTLTTYCFCVIPRFAIQPDSKYVMDPSGFCPVRDELVLGVQTSIKFMHAWTRFRFTEI